jgi:hypothetical protein
LTFEISDLCHLQFVGLGYRFRAGRHRAGHTSAEEISMVGKKLQRAIEQHRAAYHAFFSNPDIEAMPQKESFDLCWAEALAQRKIATLKFKSDEEFLHALRYLALVARKIWGDPDDGAGEHLSNIAVLIEQYLGISSEEAAKVFGVAGEDTPGAEQIAA